MLMSKKITQGLFQIVGLDFKSLLLIYLEGSKIPVAFRAKLKHL